MRFRQLPLSIRLRDSSVFASYFAGRNQPVVDALLALTRGGPPTCVWLSGPNGVGKTHLLQALCARAGQNGEIAAYLPMDDASNLGADLLTGYGEFSLVCVDDVQGVAGRHDWERALFRLHQELDERGGRLVASGPAPPAALGFKLRDLASRLNGGLVMTLQPLDEQEQLEALRLRAQQRGVELPDDAAQFLIRRLPRNMASLCAFLDELDEASLAAQRRLTVPFVRDVMERK
ncbi:MAG: DnaA regulatory inactivator Hda [Steroidobacter sp.]